MPDPTGRGSRDFLPSANQALVNLEKATGETVMVVETPELQDAQAQAMETNFIANLAELKPSTHDKYPDGIYALSVAMNAAYAIQGSDFLGKPCLTLPPLDSASFHHK
jgi:hypothetical protein